MTSPASDPSTSSSPVNGIHIHVARLTGGPRPLLLLHGWPEFWLTWLPVMQRLAAQGYDVIAPDLRGFGDSDKPDAGPSDKAGADVHAARHAGAARCAAACRASAWWRTMSAPASRSRWRARRRERFNGIFLFDCPYAGIGARWSAPEHLKEIWYYLPEPEAVCGRADRQLARGLRHLLPPLPHALGGRQPARLRRRVRRLHRQLHAARQPAGRLQLVHQPERRAARCRARRGAAACRRSTCRPACAGASWTRSCSTPGATGWARCSPTSTSRRSRASGISRTARRRTGRARRSPASLRSLSASPRERPRERCSSSSRSPCRRSWWR